MEKFADLLSPISEKEFLENYLDKKPLHIKAKDRQKFSHIMSWQILNSLLNMRTSWSNQSMMLMLNKKKISADKYCEIMPNRNGGEVYQPVPQLVKNYVKQGASVICNDIDQLTPDLSALTGMMEKMFKAKCQCNLYCSWDSVQAFESHFDTHDVFALHVEGTKTWRIFKGRAPHPVPHPSFADIPQEQHNQNRGEVDFLAHMEPGDLLYIPRGYYHDAVATKVSEEYGNGCIHIALGVNRVLGLDIFDMLREFAIQSEFMRDNVPGDLETSAPGYLNKFSKEISQLLKSSEFADAIKQYQNQYSYNREDYDLPNDSVVSKYVVKDHDYEIIPYQGQHIMKNSQGQAMPLPVNMVDLMKWLLSQDEFSRKDFDQKVANINDLNPDKFLSDMQQIQVLKSA